MTSFSILLSDKESKYMLELKEFWDTKTRTEVFRKLLKLAINMKKKDNLRQVL